MQQIRSDWHEVWSPEKLEIELGIKFEGPGLYLSKEDTILVTPCRNITSDDIWNYKQPDATFYDINVWNCNFQHTIFAAMHNCPTRMDKR